jgi:hypothetical protein
MTMMSYGDLFHVFCVLLNKHGGTVTLTPQDLAFPAAANKSVTVARTEMPQAGPGVFTLDLVFERLPTLGVYVGGGIPAEYSRQLDEAYTDPATRKALRDGNWTDPEPPAVDQPRRPPWITCPDCGMTSWNRNDVATGWCGKCNAYTATWARIGGI